MKENILQTFLNKQFIKTSEITNIENLKKAVALVKKLLIAKKYLVIPYTLVALDPQISEKDPVVAEVETVIIKNWPTFKNSTSTDDKATTYIRIVILEALSEIASDEKLGAIIWLTGRNVISYYQLQKEQEPLSELLIDIGTLFEQNSRKYWSITKPTIKNIQELSIALPELKSNKIGDKTLTNNLYKASIYTGWADGAGAGVPGENPSYASQGNWEWEKSFSQKAGAAIAELINSAIINQDQSLTTISEGIQTSINEYFVQFKDFFEDASLMMNQSSEATNKRGNLLWWKQTLYSPSLNISYRKQNEIKNAMAMAYDLSQLVGLIYPESVNHLLREALRDIYGEHIDTPKTFDFWIEKAKAEAGKSLLKDLVDSTSNRKTMSTAVANILYNNWENNLTQETGIDSAQEISLSDFAVWFFQDLQAKKIASQK